MMANPEVDVNPSATTVLGDEPAPPYRPGGELPELLTSDEVAALLKVSKSWVYEHTRTRGTPRSGRLPHVRIGKYVRFEPRAVREFLARLTKIA
jgi:excisionase family DNA binding protein